MQENIRKIVKTAERHCRASVLEARVGRTNASPVLVFAFGPSAAGCPILAVPLFLRQGWETTKASPVLVFAFGPSPKRRKSVAKARKTPQVTTRNINPINNIGGSFRKKHPTPPLFRPNRGVWHTQDVYRSCLPKVDKSAPSPPIVRLLFAFLAASRQRYGKKSLDQPEGFNSCNRPAVEQRKTLKSTGL